MSVSELLKMIDQSVQRSTEVEQLYFFDDGNLHNLPFLDDILNTPHNSEFK